MTLTSTTSRNDYPGTGSAGPFAYDFRIYAATDLLVTKADVAGIETTLAYPADFSVTGISARVGGTITLSTALATGERLTIRRVRPLTQLINLRNQGATFPANVEDGLDQNVMIDQQLTNDILSSVRLAETVDPAVFDTRLPANMVAGDAIVVNGAGTGFSQATLTAAQLSAWSATHNLTVDVFNDGVDFTAGVSDTLTLSADPGNVDNVSVVMRISGLNRVFERDEYSVATATLTFTSVIPAGTTRIEVTYMYTYQVNTAVSENVSYTQSGTGAIQRDVRSRLREEYYSVTDFGATGDGTTDDTVAVQAALDAAIAAKGICFFPPGKYRVTESITVTGANIASPKTGAQIMGAGFGSMILNQASAGKPTFALLYAQYMRISNLTIGGDSGHPNTAISFIDSGFAEFDHIAMFPNGIGFYSSGCNTVAINDCSYWPSGYNPGGFSTSGTNKTNAILVDGANGNDFHINALNAVGVETIANGGACIKFNTTALAGYITITNCELEGSGVRALDMTNGTLVFLTGCFADNANFRFLGSSYVTVENMGSGGTTWTIGDGTAPHACQTIVLKNCYGDTFTCDSFSTRCGAEHSTFAVGGYNNAGSYPITVSVATTASVLLPFPGYWQDVTFNAGDFTAATGTWVVGAGDVAAFQYAIIGKTLFINCKLITTSPTGGPSAVLYVKIPGGYTAAKGVSTPAFLSIRGGATSADEAITVSVSSPGDTVVNLARYSDGTTQAKFASNVNQTDIAFSIAIEIQ